MCRAGTTLFLGIKCAQLAWEDLLLVCELGLVGW